MENPTEVQVQEGRLRVQFGKSYRGRTDGRNSNPTSKPMCVLRVVQAICSVLAMDVTHRLGELVKSKARE